MILSNDGVEMAPRDDVPVIIGMLMDRLNVSEFEFPIGNLLHYVGRLSYDYNPITGTYKIRLSKE